MFKNTSFDKSKKLKRDHIYQCISFVLPKIPPDKIVSIKGSKNKKRRKKKVWKEIKEIEKGYDEMWSFQANQIYMIFFRKIKQHLKQ